MKKFLVSFVAVFFVFSGAASAFSDVPPDHFYYKSITWLEEMGVVVGYSDGSFRPEAEVNRAEFLKMLYESLGGLDSQESIDVILPFEDVPADEWFTDYVEMGYSKGVVDGYPDGTFKPADFINVAEALKIVLEGFMNVEMIYGYDRGESYNPCYGWEDGDLKSVSDVNAWYWKYIFVGDGTCIIPIEMVAGYAGNIFDPSKKLTRGEMAEILYRSKAVGDHSMGLFTAIYSDSLEPVSLLKENEFDLNELEVGDEIVGWTVENIKPLNDQKELSNTNLEATFSGEITISGTIDLDENYGYGCDTAIFYLDEESKIKFPKLHLDIRNKPFCFSNYLYTWDSIDGLVGDATVVIDEYTYKYLSTGVKNSMNLKEVIEFDSYI